MSSAPNQVLYRHPKLGDINGVQVADGVNQFRNLTYGIAKQRWQHSELCERFDTTVYDATQWGKISPQPPDSIGFDFGLIQKDISVDRALECDEDHCLNLTVTAPAKGEKLPVMVL